MIQMQSRELNLLLKLFIFHIQQLITPNIPAQREYIRLVKPPCVL